MSETPSNAKIPSSPRVIALILASAIFMEQVDSTAIATALPEMALSLGVPPLSLSAAVTAYLLSLAVFIPISGAVADRLGSRTVFRLAIGIFTLGSMLCGAANSVPLLIAARVLQGIGGAMMVPVGRLVLLRSVPKSEFVAMMAWVLTPAMMGPMVGPLLGGYLSTYWSWRWIFYVNVPLGIIGIILVTLFIPEFKDTERKAFDWKGAFLSGVTLSSLLIVFETSRGDALPLSFAVTMVAISLVSGLLYFRHAFRHPSPVIDFRLLRIPTFFVSASAGMLFRLSFGAFSFLMPLLLQLGFGVSAARSGMITFVGAIGSVLMKAISSPVVRLLGYRNLLIWNGLISSTLIAVCGLFRPDWPIMLIYTVLLVGGTFRSLQYTGFGTLAYADIPPEKTAASIGFHSMIQQFSVTLGVAASAGTLSLVIALNGHDAPTLGDFTITFFVVAAVSAAAVPICLTLRADAGAELSGHRLKGPKEKPEGAHDAPPGSF